MRDLLHSIDLAELSQDCIELCKSVKNLDRLDSIKYTIPTVAISGLGYLE